MADKALTAGTPRVRSLAERIKAAQDPEIEAMPGMASQEEPASLGKVTGADADRLFLTVMIKHHEEALEMLG